MIFNIYEFHGHERNLIGKFILDGINAGPRGDPEIEITFEFEN